MERLRAELKSGSLVEEIEDRVRATLPSDVKVESVRRVFRETQKRLSKEKLVLNRKGNTNLLIGIVTTAIAMGFLFFNVIAQPEKPLDSTPAVLGHFPV
jgi:hypothetical protein